MLLDSMFYEITCVLSYQIKIAILGKQKLFNILLMQTKRGVNNCFMIAHTKIRNVANTFINTIYIIMIITKSN